MALISNSLFLLNIVGVSSGGVDVHATTSELLSLLRLQRDVTHEILGQTVTWERGFVKCFLIDPKLFCSFPPAQASKGYFKNIVNKTSYPSNSPSWY